MTDLKEMLDRQARWQKSRALLTWPEKMRMVEAVRESVQALRAQAVQKQPESPGAR